MKIPFQLGEPSGPMADPGQRQQRIMPMRPQPMRGTPMADPELTVETNDPASQQLVPSGWVRPMTPPPLEDESPNVVESGLRSPNRSDRKALHDWSAEENVRLIQAQLDLGNKWPEIAARLPRRSGSAAKNQFYRLMSAKTRKKNQAGGKEDHPRVRYRLEADGNIGFEMKPPPQLADDGCKRRTVHVATAAPLAPAAKGASHRVGPNRAAWPRILTAPESLSAAGTWPTIWANPVFCCPTAPQPRKSAPRPEYAEHDPDIAAIKLEPTADTGLPAGSGAGASAHPHALGGGRAASSEKDALLAQKLGQLQPFIAAFPQECVDQPASFGPT
jgi:hypothetical protein